MPGFALLCPGQGAQHAGMFALANTSEVAAAMVSAMDAQQWMGISLAQALSSAGSLFSNRIAQPLIVAVTLANWLALRDALPLPDLIAGYSIGELSAHAVSGELDIQTAIVLARHRAAAMQACVQTSAPHRMIAVAGITVNVMKSIVKNNDVYIAITTGESNVILAGTADKIDAILPTLRAVAGSIVITDLPVHIASHTPLMTQAAPAWKVWLQQAVITTGSSPVLAGISAEKVIAPTQVSSSLLAQLSQTIHWDDCMDQLHEAGIHYALELGPGSALSTMLQARHPHIACRSVADFRSLQGVMTWIQRHSDMG